MPAFDADRDPCSRAREAGVEAMLLVGGVDEELAAAAIYDELRALAADKRIEAIGEI